MTRVGELEEKEKLLTSTEAQLRNEIVDLKKELADATHTIKANQTSMNPCQIIN